MAGGTVTDGGKPGRTELSRRSDFAKEKRTGDNCQSVIPCFFMIKEEENRAFLPAAGHVLFQEDQTINCLDRGEKVVFNQVNQVIKSIFFRREAIGTYSDLP